MKSFVIIAIYVKRHFYSLSPPPQHTHTPPDGSENFQKEIKLNVWTDFFFILFFTEELEGCWPLILQFIFILCKTPLSLSGVCLSFIVVLFCAHTHKHTPHALPSQASAASPLYFSACLLFSLRRPRVITVRGGTCTDLCDLGHQRGKGHSRLARRRWGEEQEGGEAERRKALPLLFGRKTAGK